MLEYLIVVVVVVVVVIVITIETFMAVEECTAWSFCVRISCCCCCYNH